MGSASSGTRTLRVGITSRVHTLNPRDAGDLLSTSVVAQVFETPYAPPRGEGPAVPVLFDGPLRPEGTDGLGWSGGVRAGVAFSDGTPLTAAHVAASLSRVDAVTAQARVEARGDRVLFLLRSPNPRFDLALTLMHCGVVLDRPGRMLGTGPYVPAPGTTMEELRLVRNDKARERARIDEIAFRVLPADADGKPRALLAALAAGEVDFSTMLSRTDAAEVSGVKKSFLPANSTAILYFNTERPALRDARVRRALAMAIDRMGVTEISYPNPLAFMATSLLPPAMGASRDEIPYDVDKARALLAQAGPPAAPLKMLRVWAPRPYLPHPQPVAEAVAKQLGVIGVSVQVVVPKDRGEYITTCERGDYDLVLGGWIADTPDPADFLESNLRSDRIVAPGVTQVAACNYARIRSKSMDDALDAFRRDPSATNRAAVMRIVADEVPALPLMHGPTVIVHAWRVKNVEISSVGVPHFAAFELD